MRQPSDYRYASDDPFGHIRPSGRAHTGSDWVAPTGSPVYAVADGEVYASGWSNGNGNYLAQTLPDGKTWSYIHLSEQLVGLGAVRQGDVIALSGNTGSTSRGPHLHCSCAADGNPRVYLGIGSLIDPYAYLTAVPPTPPQPIGEDMAQGAFYRANPAIYWQEKPNTPFTALSIWTWNAYAAQGNRYIEIPKAELDALIKKYGLIPNPPTK
jgi:murein DD-endopeptidase MepM/ murein hydrolase activator NlpD